MPLLIVLAAVVLVLAAGAAVFAIQRGRESERAVGFLARETRSRDEARVKSGRDVEAEAITGRDVEAQVASERNVALVPVAPSALPAVWKAPDADQMGVTRRQFMNRSIVAGFGLGIGTFAPACLAFLWPQSSTGFGSKIAVGKVAEIQAKVASGNGFFYYPEGRMWITDYPTASIDNAKKIYSDPELAGMEAGLVALYQKCPHLGCRVPSCATSQWFECGCHGSQYNRVGEKKGGPAPRGMDRFAMSVNGGIFTVDTGLVIQGPAIGTNTTGQEAEGPHCVSGGAGH